MSIEDRIARLERQNRRLQCMVAMLVLMLTAGLVLGLAAPEEVPDVVEAKTFRVVDDDGTVLAALFGRGGIGQLTTFSDEKPLFHLSKSLGGHGMLSTYDAKGRDIVVLGATDNGEGTIRTVDPATGHAMVRLTSAIDGGGMILVSNKSGTDVAEFHSSAWGGALRLLSGERKSLVELTSTMEGEGIVAVKDPNGAKPATYLQPGE